MVIEKTVFISYRRSNIPWALAIFQNLTHHGFDVFFDYSGIASGDFGRVILGNIRARAHFLILLTPSALERCGDPEDWLRREIEAALEVRRNIVPVMLDGFDFAAPGIAGQLTGGLAALRNYNALRIQPEYFEEGMDRLRGRYLNVALDAVLHPASVFAQQAAIDQQTAARTAPVIQEMELTARDWVERGRHAADARDHAQAVVWFRKAAEAGDPSGMAHLGGMYESGSGGLPEDAVQAVYWFRRSAAAGDVLGMRNLGVMFRDGRGGLPQDDAQAVSLFRKAADAGNPRAMSNLGFMYETGRGGLPRDDAQAVTWFRKSAEAGDPLGMANLSIMYRDGRGGLPTDDAQAFTWCRKSADAGEALGMSNLGFLYESGRGGLQKDKALAKSWYRKAAQLGDGYARKALQRLGEK